MVGRAEDSAWAGRTGWLGKQAKRRKEAGDHHQTRVSSVLLPRINSSWLISPFLGSQLSTSLGRPHPPKRDGGLVSLRNTEAKKALWKASTQLKLMRSCAGPFCISGSLLHRCRKDY